MPLFTDFAILTDLESQLSVYLRMTPESGKAHLLLILHNLIQKAPLLTLWITFTFFAVGILNHFYLRGFYEKDRVSF